MINFEWQDSFNPGDDEFVRKNFDSSFYHDLNAPFFTPNERLDGYGLGDSMMGVEIESISASRCHICVTVNYTLGFVQYPSSTVCYIKPECQPPDLPIEYRYPGDPEDAIPPIPLDISLPPSSVGYYLRARFNYTFSASYHSGTGELQNNSFPTPDYVGAWRFYIAPGWTVKSKTITSRAGVGQGSQFGLMVGGQGFWTRLYIGYFDADGYNEIPSPVPAGSDSTPEGTIALGGYGIYSRIEPGEDEPHEVTFSRAEYYNVWTEGADFSLSQQSSLLRPPQPPNNEEKHMDCCPEILRRLRKIENDLLLLKKWTGAQPGEMKLPTTFLDRSPGNNWLANLADFLAPNQITIKSLPEYFKWKAEREQEWWGQWPAMWGDKDGNEIAYPNLATAISEIARQLSYANSQENLTQMAVLKTLLEVGLNRHNGILIASMAEAIIDWLEVPTEEYKKEIRHQFIVPEDGNVDPNNIDTIQEVEKFLQNATHFCTAIKLSSQKINGKSPDTFGATAQRVFKILEMLESQHLKIDKNNIEQGLKNYLLQYLKNTGKLNDGEEDSDLSQWLDKVERQFGTEPNPPDGSGDNPWGGSMEERPRIVIRGDNVPE